MGRVIRPARPATPALSRTLILPPRCILNAGSSLIGSNEPTSDGPDDTSAAELRPVELGSGIGSSGIEPGRVRPGRVTIAPQTAGVLLAEPAPIV